MGLPTLGVCVLLAALVRLGVEPIAAHLCMLCFGMMSMATPPIALAALAAPAIARAPAKATAWAAMRFGWSDCLVPVPFVFSPMLIMIGTPVDGFLAAATATTGVWRVSAALAGSLAGPLSPLVRGLFALGGLVVLAPAGAFPGAVVSDVHGEAGGIVLVAARRSRTAADHRRTSRRDRRRRGRDHDAVLDTLWAVRRDGVEVARDKVTPGVVAVAAPILAGERAPIAALCPASDAAEVDGAPLEAIRRDVKDSAGVLSEAVPMMTDPRRRFELMDMFGPESCQVLSIASPSSEKCADPAKPRTWRRSPPTAWPYSAGAIPTGSRA